MKSLTVQIPDDVANGLIAEAAQRQISPEQVAAEQLIRMSPASKTKPTQRYASFFGAAKGQPGSYGSVEEIDRYMTELRNEW